MDAESVCRQFGKLKDQRSNLDAHCQEIAERMLPYHANFITKRTMGEKRTEKMFDSTAALALTRFSAAFTSMVTPEGSRYQTLTTTSKDLNKNVRVRAYFDEVGQILFRERYRGRFGSQVQECWTGLGAFGTSCMLIEPSKAGGLWHKSIPLSNIWIAEDSEGKIDTVYRSFKRTLRQAYQQFGDKLPQEMIECLEAEPHKEYEFLHVVCPNAEMDASRLDYLGMPWASAYICMQHKDKIISRGGYHTFPYAPSRFMTVSGEAYGYSPAMTILADNKMLNEIEKTRMTAAHLQTLPPLLLNDDLMGNPINFKPSALNYGGINSQGQQMIVPMQTGANSQIPADLAEQKRSVINDAFFVSLFQILVESHTMSATEVIERAREKGALMSPAFSRQNTEFLSAVTERELDILARQGRLPEMPDELKEAGGDYEVVFENPLARAQKSEALAALARTFEFITPVAQIDSSVLMNFDFDEIVRDIPEITGMKPTWIRSKEAVSQIREQQQLAQQQQEMLAAAPVLANLRKTELENQQMAMSGPSGRV